MNFQISTFSPYFEGGLPKLERFTDFIKTNLKSIKYKSRDLRDTTHKKNNKERNLKDVITKVDIDTNDNDNTLLEKNDK